MIDAVIKVGGALLASPSELGVVVAALDRIAPARSLLIVPGGGPFANAVRAVDRMHALTDDDAHWMAILGMEQFAILLATRLSNAELVHRRGDIACAHSLGRLPVLAPYRWLREADPLPHSWDVTSDSIAAWIASQVGAPRLILIKPAAHDSPTIVDRYFDRARSPSLECSFVTPAMLNGNWFPA
ncbi:MAG: aspartate kinase [Gemmatimonadaceae bacterium]